MCTSSLLNNNTNLLPRNITRSVNILFVIFQKQILLKLIRLKQNLDHQLDRCLAEPASRASVRSLKTPRDILRLTNGRVHGQEALIVVLTRGGAPRFGLSVGVEY